MQCNTNTMLKAAAGLAAVMATAYFAFPAAHSFILASAPFLVALLCPISTLFMMKAMASKSAESPVKGEPERWPAPELGPVKKLDVVDSLATHDAGNALPPQLANGNG
jgi:hypothetical protein